MGKGQRMLLLSRVEAVAATVQPLLALVAEYLSAPVISLLPLLSQPLPQLLSTFCPFLLPPLDAPTLDAVSVSLSLTNYSAVFGRFRHGSRRSLQSLFKGRSSLYHHHQSNRTFQVICKPASQLRSIFCQDILLSQSSRLFLLRKHLH